MSRWRDHGRAARAQERADEARRRATQNPMAVTYEDRFSNPAQRQIEAQIERDQEQARREAHNAMGGLGRGRDVPWEWRWARRPAREVQGYPEPTAEEAHEQQVWQPWLDQFGRVIRDHQEAPE